MSFSPAYLATKDQIAIALAARGWTVVDQTSLLHTAVVATRRFQTAAGPKQATAFLSASGTLTADYHSEGRNILSTVWHNVENNLTDECVVEVAEQFNREVEDVVERSYAARLLH